VKLFEAPFFIYFLPLSLLHFYTFSQVQDLISNSQLNISSEEKVFTAVLNWIKHDLTERKKHIAELISNVRLPLLNREFLMENVETEPLVREDPTCKELLLEAMVSFFIYSV
jgi:kelch-like protein 17 (actinfilin)